MNQAKIELTLPLPPSVNAIYRINPFGSLYLTTEGKEYKAKIAEWVENWMKENNVSPLAGTVIMRIWIAWPDSRQRDPGNLLKILPDALENVAWEGSDQCVFPHLMPPVICCADVPRVHIELTEAQPTYTTDLPALPKELIEWQMEAKHKRKFASAKRRLRKKHKTEKLNRFNFKLSREDLSSFPR